MESLLPLLLSVLPVVLSALLHSRLLLRVRPATVPGVLPAVAAGLLQEPCEYCPPSCYPSCPEYCGNYCFPGYYGRNWWEKCDDRYKDRDYRKHDDEFKRTKDNSKISSQDHITHGERSKQLTARVTSAAAPRATRGSAKWAELGQSHERDVERLARLATVNQRRLAEPLDVLDRTGPCPAGQGRFYFLVCAP